MVIVAVVNLSVEEQVRFAKDFVVEKKLVAEGIVVDMAENIVVDGVEDMTKERVVDIAEWLLRKLLRIGISSPSLLWINLLLLI